MRKTLYCPLRKEEVAATPEEIVRQQLLSDMQKKLGYPPSSIAVERALKQLPHLACCGEKLPDRRVDILVYSNREGRGLLPLLLIECKAIELKPAALRQVAGYNHYIDAPFIAVANGEKSYLGWYDSAALAWRTVDFIPRYSELKAALQE